MSAKKGTLFPYFTPISAKKINSVSIKSTAKSSSTALPSQSINFSNVLSPITNYVNNTAGEAFGSQLTPARTSDTNSKKQSREFTTELIQSFQKRLKSNLQNENDHENPDMMKRITIKCEELNSQKKQTHLPDAGSQEATDATLSQTIKLLHQAPEEKRTSLGFPTTSSQNHQNTNFTPLSKQLKMEETRAQEKSNFGKSHVSESTLAIIQNLRAKRNINPPEAEKSVRNHSQLSAQTLNIIKDIQAKSFKSIDVSKATEAYSKALTAIDLVNVNENLANAKDVLFSSSLREKYEELLGKEREYLLPVSYKKLLKIFEAVDSVLNNLLNAKKLPFFDTIMEKIRIEYNRITSYTHLAQIIFAQPTAYKVSWEKSDPVKEELELYAIFPNDENGARVLSASKLEERSRRFRECLVQITKKYHVEFLKMRGKEYLEKDYDQQKCWDSEFDVNSCPVIPEAKLSQIPSQSKLEQKYKQETGSENTKPIILEAKDKDNQKKFIISSFFASHQRRVKDISEKLLNKVQSKETFSIEGNPDLDQDKPILLSNTELNQLKKIAQTLESYYKARSTESMFFVNVKGKLASELSGEREVEESLENLIRICPEWLSSFYVNGQRILKMNKKIDADYLDKKLALERI